jgi:uncharacterized protein
MTQRIAVVGMLRSGKTTFLTSLIDHWLNHDPDKLPLRQGKELLCRWKDDSSAGAREFSSNRQRLSESRWPVKTLKPVSYELAWKYQGDYFYRRLELFDIPGERLADADMLICGGLNHWSQHLVHLFEKDPRTRGPFQTFSRFFHEQRSEAAYDEWIKDLELAYREFIATLIYQQHPLATPSSMLINKDGKYVPKDRRRNPERLRDWLIHEADLGFGDRRLFPLPEPLIQSPVGKIMQRTYRGYVLNVVWPALGPIASASDLLVLTDIAGILESGPTWMNTIDHFYGLVAKFADPGGLSMRAVKKSWQWLSWAGTLGYHSPGHLERVFIVATQADRVHRMYQNDLLGLAKQSARPTFKHLQASSGVTIKTLAVSAVASTVSRDDGKIQYLKKTEEGLQEVQAVAAALPRQLPDDWKKGDFQFPLCQPKLPALQKIPPNQFGLQLLTDELLG